MLSPSVVVSVVLATILVVARADLLAPCVNGGTPIDSTECACPSLWNGLVCDEIVCVNGGRPVEGRKNECYCPKGYYGVHCDAAQIARPVDGVFNVKPSFNIFIHSELTDWYGLNFHDRLMAVLAKEPSLQIGKDGMDRSYYKSARLFKADAFNNTEVLCDFPESPNDGLDQFAECVAGNVTYQRPSAYDCFSVDFYDTILGLLKENKVEHSVLLVMSQHPPTPDEENEKALMQYLTAFGVQVNVVVPYDEIMLSCSERSYDAWQRLARRTNGEFVTFQQEEQGDPDNLLPRVVAASAHPQSHYFSAQTICDSNTPLSISVTADLAPVEYVLSVRRPIDKPGDVTVVKQCSQNVTVNITPDSISYVGETRYYAFFTGGYLVCNFTIITNSECSAKVYSLGAPNGNPQGIRLFSSFVSRDYIDSQSVQLYLDDNTYLSLHVDVGQGVYAPITAFLDGYAHLHDNERVNPNDFTLRVRQKASTFEFISSDSFKCANDATLTWMQIELFSTANTSFTFNRYIPIDCLDRIKPAPIPTPQLMRWQMTEERKPRHSLYLVYSNQFYDYFADYSLVSSSTEGELPEKLFDHFGVLRFDTMNDADHPLVQANNYTVLSSVLYNNAADSKDSPMATDSTNIMNALSSLVSQNADIDIDQNTLISMAVHQLTFSIPGQTMPANLATLVNRGVKMVLWGGINSKTSPIQETDDYNRIAALSAGHFVIMDLDEVQVNDPEENTYFHKILTDFYVRGPSQKLLSFSNTNIANVSSIANKQIGEVRVPASDFDEVNVTVTITLTVKDPTSVMTPQLWYLELKSTDDVDGGDRVAVDFASATDKPYGRKCNAGIDTVTLKTNKTYEATLTVIGGPILTGVHVRYWVDRGDDGAASTQINYKDYAFTPQQPNEFIGAAARIDVDSTVTEVSISYRDCSGKQPHNRDNSQTITFDPSDHPKFAQFVPYFCSSDQSIALSTNNTTECEGFPDIYTVEISITSEDGVKRYVRPMLCSPSTGVPKCNSADDDGNIICDGNSNPPFYRGPEASLIDCSDPSGKTIFHYKTNNYTCECSEGFRGDSCVNSYCKTKEAVTFDTKYRTLSFVFIYSKDGNVCPFVEDFKNQAQEAVFGNSKNFQPDSNNFTNIWHYSLTIMFDNGETYALYRGANFMDFFTAFDKINDMGEQCPDDPELKNISLGDAFAEATNGLGRESRGITMIYFSSAWKEYLYEPIPYTVGDFYERAQTFKQTVFLFTPTFNEELARVTAATGGATIFINDAAGQIPQSFRENLASIANGDIGFSTLKVMGKGQTFKINSKGILIITATTREDREAVTFGSVSCPAADCLELSDLSAMTAADTTQNTEVSTKDLPNDNATVQIVLLTTANPILTALIPRGDSVDFNAAAPVTSGVPIHLALNRDNQTTFTPWGNDSSIWRQADRDNCNFMQEFVPFTLPFKEKGPYIAEFIYNDKSKTPPLSDVTLAIPLTVTEEIWCMNGGTFNPERSSCDCTKWLTGPACSKPVCGGKGVLSTWGDACDCSSSPNGGPTCNGDAEE